MCNIYGINAKVLTIFDTPSRIITGWTAIFYPKKKKKMQRYLTCIELTHTKWISIFPPTTLGLEYFQTFYNYYYVTASICLVNFSNRNQFFNVQEPYCTYLYYPPETSPLLPVCFAAKLSHLIFSIIGITRTFSRCALTCTPRYSSFWYSFYFRVIQFIKVHALRRNT